MISKAFEKGARINKTRLILQTEYVSSRYTMQAVCDIFMRGANKSLIHLGRKDWAELIARLDIGTYIVFSNIYDIL